MLHAPQFDIADDVVDGQQPHPVLGAVGRLLSDVPRQVRALVAVAPDERVHDLAVGCDRRQFDLAEVVLDDVRLDDSFGAARNCLAERHARRPVPAGRCP